MVDFWIFFYFDRDLDEWLFFDILVYYILGRILIIEVRFKVGRLG